MRHEPERVRRIAMKPAAELIVQPAFGHLATGVQDHLKRFLVALALELSQQEFQVHCGWKLRRAAKTARARVVAPSDSALGLIQNRRRQNFIRFTRRPYASQLTEHRGS